MTSTSCLAGASPKGTPWDAYRASPQGEAFRFQERILLQRFPTVDEREYALLNRRFGPAVRRTCDVVMSPASLDHWLKVIQQNRRGEVGMVILRPSGRVLVHTKEFYPDGVFRFPTGGIAWGESVLHALEREVWEETELTAEILRPLAVLEYRFTDGAREIPFVTYLFLLRHAPGNPSLQDADERIAGFDEVEKSQLYRVADALERLGGDWLDWGRFRTVAHRLAAELLSGADV